MVSSGAEAFNNFTDLPRLSWLLGESKPNGVAKTCTPLITFIPRASLNHYLHLTCPFISLFSLHEHLAVLRLSPCLLPWATLLSSFLLFSLCSPYIHHVSPSDGFYLNIDDAFCQIQTWILHSKCQWPPLLIWHQGLSATLIQFLAAFSMLLNLFGFPKFNFLHLFLKAGKYAATQQLLKFCFFNKRPHASLLILLWVCGMSCSILSGLPGISSCLFWFIHSCWMKRDLPRPELPLHYSSQSTTSYSLSVKFPSWVSSRFLDVIWLSLVMQQLQFHIVRSNFSLPSSPAPQSASMQISQASFLSPPPLSGGTAWAASSWSALLLDKA